MGEIMDRELEFRGWVDKILAHTLDANSFKLEEVISKYYCVGLVYKSPKGRLKIYDDIMNGEVNCELQIIKDSDVYSKWYYIRMLSGVYKNKTTEELLRDFSYEGFSYEDSLNEMKYILEKYIDVMWAELRALD